MSKEKIKSLIENRIKGEGLVESGLPGVQFFRVTESQRCAPAIYEPMVVAIVSGTKEAILDGARYEYDKNQYMCCSMSMPVEAGTPKASPDNPLVGVLVSLDTKVMTELAIEYETVGASVCKHQSGELPSAFKLATWDHDFTDALTRLVELADSEIDMAILGKARLREFYYTVLKGSAGASARRAFGIGNEIARAIDFLSTNLDASLSIDEIASKIGMSRAVFHRKFKQATSMSPIQFLKSMRLNNAAMKIAQGATVTQAALDVGYVSSSQFSREFKRLYGLSPKQWIKTAPVLAQ